MVFGTYRVLTYFENCLFNYVKENEMIIFQTGHQELFNYIIHHFLKKEVFNEEMDLGDMIEILLPKYLYREQYHKCVKAFNELYQWTEDSFYHEMCALHELLLYNFIEYMANLQREIPEFNQLYIDEKGHFLIDQAAQNDLAESDDFGYEDCKEIYYDIVFYPDFLFIDTDFLFIDKIYNTRKAGETFIEDILGINIDYYFELMPQDIQEQYKTRHITLTSEVEAMLKYVEGRIQCGNLYKLFWENDTPVKEERIQLILENIMDAYFYDCACLFSKRNTDITSNIAKYSIEFHFLQGRKGQQSIAVKSFYDNYCSYCTMQN